MLFSGMHAVYVRSSMTFALYNLLLTYMIIPQPVTDSVYVIAVCLFMITVNRSLHHSINQ